MFSALLKGRSYWQVGLFLLADDDIATRVSHTFNPSDFSLGFKNLRSGLPTDLEEQRIHRSEEQVHFLNFLHEGDGDYHFFYGLILTLNSEEGESPDSKLSGIKYHSVHPANASTFLNPPYEFAEGALGDTALTSDVFSWAIRVVLQNTKDCQLLPAQL